MEASSSSSSSSAALNEEAQAKEPSGVARDKKSDKGSKADEYSDGLPSEEELDSESNDSESSDDENGGDNSEGAFESSEDDEDEEVYQQLVGLKRPVVPGSSDQSLSSSSSKRAKSSKDIDDCKDSNEEEECQFVPDMYEELNSANIVPRSKRSAALKSGLVKHENKFAHLVDDDDDGEAEF